MSTSRVTSKGQVTIPAEIRSALAIEQGDDLVFELTTHHSVELRVVKRRKLSDLFGALPATRPFPGKEAVREEVGKALGRRHEKGTAE
jgi:AbrB family looped-hinge helix DNA binding protein